MKTIIFDLDNTLYPEKTYVQSGFKAVARYLSDKYDCNFDKLFSKIMDIFNRDGRGKVFDKLVNDLNFNEEISTLVYIYRYHFPDIFLYPESILLLDNLKNNYKLALITDGRAFVQKRKVEALNIENYFDVIVFTDVLGENYWKPSPEPYKLVLNMLDCDAKDAYYIGDDPYKDFKAPKNLGMNSIQVKIEDEMDYWKKRGYERVDADFQVDNLNEILGVLYEG
ncbi:HAD family hydrolase [uncultured Methanobrevibacter sp.]|uniref:HAD family hydrolase n=1 Tax=uncultured Methanobrevibacter sp. TaxID=253161 RepID=UPI0025E4FA8E|nr:HAD family hydrolase [uncultured Methanobrevibacter sp.]